MPYPPGEFIQADALDYLLHHGSEYDAIHASPPCQDHTALTNVTGKRHGTGWMLPATLHYLNLFYRHTPWVVENVPGSGIENQLRLCGTEFELHVTSSRDGQTCWLRRHRYFASNLPLWGAGGCHCTGKRIIGVYGHGEGARREKGTLRDRRKVMGINWMTRDQLAQAIPPAYTEHIGRQIIEDIERTRTCSPTTTG